MFANLYSIGGVEAARVQRQKYGTLMEHMDLDDFAAEERFNECLRIHPNISLEQDSIFHLPYSLHDDRIVFTWNQSKSI